MASLRSCFRQGNFSCFQKRDWLNFGLRNQEILRFRAGPLSVLCENASNHSTHSPANISNTLSPHVPLLGPSVRRLLDSYGLDRLSIKPSGHKGQLLKEDVLKYINENAKTEIKFPQVLQDEIPKDPVTLDSNLGYVDIGVSSTKQAIARQLVEHKNTIPHTYGTMDCDVDNLLAFCEKFRDHSVSLNDFVIKAAALALRLVPDTNSLWLDTSPVQLKDINIAIVMESPNGLVTPVITNADQMDIVSISKTVLELKEKANSGVTTPGEIKNASFTISNLGSLGVKSFTAIIYPRQSAILAVGQHQTIVNDQNKLSGVMNVTLCCDGRVVDEQLASKWLTVFKKLIENPLQMGL